MKKTKEQIHAETVLTAFTAQVATLSSVPETEADAAEVELTDEQIEALAQRDVPIPPLYRSGMELLEAIHAEEPHFKTIAKENALASRAEMEQKADNGLVTEINRSASLVSVTDTVEGCTALLRRHQFGYKNGSRNRKGEVIIDPYTTAEHAAAEKWLESLKNGSPVVTAEEEAE